MRLNVLEDGSTLQVECAWESPLDFTIKAVLTGKWDNQAATVTFHIEQTVTHKYPGGLTGTIVTVWDGVGRTVSIFEAEGTADATVDCNLPPPPPGEYWANCRKHPVTNEPMYNLRKTGTASWRMVINP